MAASILQMVNRQRANGSQIDNKIREVLSTIISIIKFVYIQNDPGAEYIQSVPRGKVNILGGHNIGLSRQKNVHVRVSYSERFPR
jgi:hypothetical protein